MYTSLTEFLHFSALPSELRIKIWQFTLHQRRLIEIRTGDYPANVEYITNAKGNKVTDVRWVTQCPPPSVLSVCRESRHLALKVWTLRFALLSGGDEVIHINPVLDTIYINVKYSQFVPMLLKDIRSFDDYDRGVRSLALRFGDLWTFQGKGASLLTGVDMLTLVIESYVKGPYECLEEWEEGSTLVAPETKEELETWERTGRTPDRPLFEATQGRAGSSCRISALRQYGEAGTRAAWVTKRRSFWKGRCDQKNTFILL